MVSAWGTGKTLALILRTLRLLEKYPNNLGLIVRREFTDLRDSTIKDFENYTGLTVGSNKDVKLPNGSLLMFRHGEELNTLQNINLGVCGIEQADEFDDDSQWFMLFGRMRRQNCGEPSLFLIANANGDNWVNRLWPLPNDPTNKPLPGYELTEATTFDNADILPKSFLKNLETLRIQKPAVFEQFVMNSRKVTSGKIFPMWNERFHVIDDMEFPEWWETFGAMDTAVASGVFSAGLYKVTEDGDIIRFKEYYAKERLISEHCQSINDMAKGHNVTRWIADPAAFNRTREKAGQLYSIADELLDYGIQVYPGQNDVSAGINRMGEYLNINYEKPHPFSAEVGSPRFFLTKSCSNARREIPSYREVPNKVTERGDRKWAPYKKDDHSVDEIRYAIMSRPIISVKPEPKAEIGSLLYYDKQREYAAHIYEKRTGGPRAW